MADGKTVCPGCGQVHDEGSRAHHLASETMLALIDTASVLRKCSLESAVVAVSTLAAMLSQEFVDTYGEDRFKDLNELINDLAKLTEAQMIAKHKR